MDQIAEPKTESKQATQQTRDQADGVVDSHPSLSNKKRRTVIDDRTPEVQEPFIEMKLSQMTATAIEKTEKRQPEPLESKQHPIYLQTLQSDNPLNRLPAEIEKLVHNKLNLFKPLNSPDDGSAGDRIKREILLFVKDTLQMQLTQSLHPELTYRHQQLFEVLFRQFLKILDLKLFSKDKDLLINHPAAAFLKLLEMSA
jgi:hypothetical protein